MHLLKNSIGRKLIMSVTGFSMIAFVVVHLLGNTTIYHGPDGINAYAKAVHRFGSLVWVFRITLLAMFSLHVFYGIQLTLENRTAKPQGYALNGNLQTTFAARSMVWTGLLIGAFLVYHLLHFTFQVTNPQIAAGSHLDAMGRPDVFTMVVLSFRNFSISLVYICAMCALGLHLSHSIQSLFQTTGLNSEKTFRGIRKGGTLAAIIIFIGFALFPLVILAGLLK
ncbi:MAG TPA: succinate dehydrogenase cytochrome b subunit [Dissulfurispiraceae bacterium]|nr:succinate dehydrogenase cytochrome b subunit [Dissulfurispiraceae bacterium]